MSHVSLNHYALDEFDGQVILRGVLDPNTLSHLQVAAYQRDVLPIASINKLAKAFEEGRIPDIELGMRGDTMVEKDGVIILSDPVYIIDGLQRVRAAMLKVDRGDSTIPHLGAVIHLCTTEEWERRRFQILNMERVKLSPNVLLRNWRHDYSVMESLLALTGEKSFVMQGRVSWEQRMRREELITAAMFVKVIGRLHAHLAPTATSRVAELVAGLQKLQDGIGKNVLRDNVKTFFDVVDQAYGVRRVAFKEGAVYMRGTFLLSLARVLSDHTDFWRGNRLFVEAPLIRKIAQFPYRDPHVVDLAGSSGQANVILTGLFIEHINKGRTTKRLNNRHGVVAAQSIADAQMAAGDDGDDEAEAS